MSDATTPTTTPTADPPPQEEKTIDWYIDRYIRLRNKVAEKDAERKSELKPYREAMAAIEAHILRTMHATNASSIKTAAGTAYTATHTSVTVNNWGKVLEYIRENDAWELLEARVNKTTAMALIEETGTPLDGVLVRQEVTINVRSPSEKL